MNDERMHKYMYTNNTESKMEIVLNRFQELSKIKISKSGHCGQDIVDRLSVQCFYVCAALEQSVS